MNKEKRKNISAIYNDASRQKTYFGNYSQAWCQKG